MKKHILGLAVFSFIVGTGAFVYGIFSCSEITPVAVQKYVPAERTHCKFKREIDQSENNSLNVAQAIYSVKTKTLMWQGTLPNEKAARHFNLWVLDRVNFIFIGSIAAENMADGKVYISDELNRSLDKIAPSDNLYMIGAGKNGEETHRFMSNARNAVPVTIDHGE